MAPMYSMKFVPLVVLAALLQLSVIHADCDATWSVNGTKCYKLFDDRMNFENALKLCLGLGSTLATITSEETNAFVHSLEPTSAIPASSWIGGRLLDGNETTLYWTESEAPHGSAVVSDFTRWAVNFPQDREGVSCLSCNKWGRWRNKPCASKAAMFTCQKQLSCDVANCDGCIRDNICAKCSTGYEDFYNDGSCFALSAACDAGWSLHDTHEVTWSTENPYYCYILMASPVDFDTAEGWCGEGAQLSPIHNAGQNNHVKGLIAESSAVNAWVGERIYDGDTPTYYNNFSELRPPVVNADNSHDNSCVAVNAIGRWHNKLCANTKPFVCRRPWNY